MLRGRPARGPGRSQMPETPTSTVYGPVHSWRVGRSLGIDALFRSSICSFRCVYCQLGEIETPTRERKVYVETERVLADLRAHGWEGADVVTFSGSGEPTLAANLGELIRGVKAFTGLPVMVLTNATMLNDPAVRADLAFADRVSCKLDAGTDRALALVNRPVEGISIATIASGIEAFRAEYAGRLDLQAMFMPANAGELAAFAALVERLKPDSVQLNTPRRPVPRGWFLDARGNYDLETAPYEAVPLKHLDRPAAATLEEALARLTSVPIVSVYRD